MQNTFPTEQRFRVLILNRIRLFLGNDSSYRNMTPGLLRTPELQKYVLPEGIIYPGEDSFPIVRKFCKDALQVDVEEVVPLDFKEEGEDITYYIAYSTTELGELASYSFRRGEVDYFWCIAPMVKDLLLRSKEVIDNRTLLRVVDHWVAKGM